VGFDKRYPKSKDARKRMHRYRDSRDFDGSCRNHGGCGWCRDNRTHATVKRKLAAEATRDEA